MKNKYCTLLEISREDLNASKLLFENEMYPQSLFYFQQSAEKLVKYIGLREEVIENKDLQSKVSHKTTLIFKKAITRHLKQFPLSIDLDVDKKFQAINIYINDNPIPEVICVISCLIIDTIENEPSLPFDIESVKTIEDFFEILEQINPNDPNIEKLRKMNDNELYKPILERMIKDLKSKLPNYIQGIMVLFYVNSLSEKFVSSVRYPNIDDMINPSINIARKIL